MSQHSLLGDGKKKAPMKKVNPAALLISQRLQIRLGVQSVPEVGELCNPAAQMKSALFSVRAVGETLSSPPLRSDAFSKTLLGLVLPPIS